jgi:hypothetical protein
VAWLGPPEDRDPEYIRDREFDHLVKISSARPADGTARPAGSAGTVS